MHNNAKTNFGHVGRAVEFLKISSEFDFHQRVKFDWQVKGVLLHIERIEELIC